MKLIKGCELTADARRDVLAAFAHRHTVEHPFPNHSSGVPIDTDDQWLARLSFYVTRDGRLSRKHRYARPGFIADRLR